MKRFHELKIEYDLIHRNDVTIQDPRSQALPTGPRLTGESQ